MMTRADRPTLITGAGGFVGSHLARRLLDAGASVHGADLRPPATDLAADGNWTFHRTDLTASGTAADLLAATRPERIFHLAGQSSAGASFEDPSGTFSVNLDAGLELLEAVRALPAAERPRIICAGSAEEYGPPDGEAPLTEDAPLRPASPYGVSKAALTLLCRQYAAAFGLDAIAVRPFPCTGAGQAPVFAFPAFARQIVAIERGASEPVLRVGNLEARRDYLHVADTVDAYLALMDRGSAGEIYNICSGNTFTIRRGLGILLEIAGLDVTIERDPDRFRPLDVPCLAGDPGKLNAATGWRPRRDPREALEDLLDWTRENDT